MKKAKNSFYIEESTVKEMRIEAAHQEKSFPSEFILYLWKEYKKRNKR